MTCNRSFRTANIFRSIYSNLLLYSNVCIYVLFAYTYLVSGDVMARRMSYFVGAFQSYCIN